VGAIGFELRKHLRTESFGGILRGYGYAGLISAGPWVVSILGVLISGKLCLSAGVPPHEVRQFAVSVTYLMAGSLILTGVLQLMFTRFVSDRLFEERAQVVVPNLLGALTLTTVVSGALGAGAVLAFFGGQPFYYRALMMVCFVCLCDLWVVVVLLSGLKAYRAVLWVLFLGYALFTASAYAMSSHGLPGMLAGFTLAQAVIFFALLALIVLQYPAFETGRLVSFEFLRRDQSFYSLLLIGLLNNLAIWSDKFIFWMTPHTSDMVIGPLRASLIYDLPIFLAYLSIIPGMGVFLMRMETDFAERYDAFYDAVRGGESLGRIYTLKDRMVFALRQGIYEIFKVQGMTAVALILAGPRLLDAIGISRLYLPLFNIDLVGVGMQMVLLGVLNAVFYFDYRRSALLINFIFLAGNILFTMISLRLGYAFYGYGYALATTTATFAGLMVLQRRLDDLEYETFMLQR